MNIKIEKPVVTAMDWLDQLMTRKSKGADAVVSPAARQAKRVHRDMVSLRGFSVADFDDLMPNHGWSGRPRPPQNTSQQVLISYKQLIDKFTVKKSVLRLR